ncbi:hypothetical protein [Paenibacillus sinopodophylli]|uniref:hypothetical protein n=1 Tax=Paenibacillus sinopodophylli TaxID=1837342 RepID=UPI00110CB385|nr:hypothetical protein [Paenibacillus sinopodophylli]
MTDYNMELEHALRLRPIPEKQAIVAVDKIVLPARRRTLLRHISVMLAGCALAAAVIWFAGDGYQWLKEVGVQSESQNEGQAGVAASVTSALTDAQWQDLFKGEASVAGIEVLHREQVTDHTQVLFMVKAGMEPYRYHLIQAEFVLDKNKEYQKTQVSESVPLTRSQWPELEAGNDWITFSKQSFHQQAGPDRQVAFGYILNSRVTEIKLTDSKGLQEDAAVQYDSKGQGFWFKVLSASMSEAPYYADALNRRGDSLLKIDSEKGNIATRSSSVHDLTTAEWWDIYNGDTVDSRMEMLHKEQLAGNQWVMFMAGKRLDEGGTDYRLAVTSLRQAQNGTYLPTVLSVAASKGMIENSIGQNAWFSHEWSVSSTDQNPPVVHIFGLVKNAQVASIQLTNPEGKYKTLKLLQNSEGDAFFFSYLPNEWMKQGGIFQTEALNKNGESLYMESEWIAR